MCNSDLIEQDELLKNWRAQADYANSTGSRVHFLLETDLLKMYKSDKEVRKPIPETFCRNWSRANERGRTRTSND